MWWANLPDPKGSEPGYRRPVLVIQDDLLATLHKLIQRCSAVLGRQRGLGGSPHERLPWFPPLALCIKK
ncbi:type II toxin-antitoxin system PemK/MazF family toxin [Moorena sp. SIOASIH]|uniref:type II toxin-antitoxin system PemK/MazF family toxin n=1 Tax=Moorena sp. SIOASIH TaxID=2607817 RepID=UPI0025D4F5C7|nr:type II toxin-antitoxin system PemK/MazF family toxin [Moorena sp. SIOASIH]